MRRLNWSLWSVSIALLLLFRGISAWNNGSLLSNPVVTTLTETEGKPSFSPAVLPSGTEQPSVISSSAPFANTDPTDRLLSTLSAASSSSKLAMEKIDYKSFTTKSSAVLTTSKGHAGWCIFIHCRDVLTFAIIDS
ncbi:hypothetical protein ACROYT_G005810 [Oculina patagonica]